LILALYGTFRPDHLPDRPLCGAVARDAAINDCLSPG
jgi:hypothetical protein